MTTQAARVSSKRSSERKFTQTGTTISNSSERTSRSSSSSITTGSACTRRWATDLLRSSSDKPQRGIGQTVRVQRWSSLREVLSKIWTGRGVKSAASARIDEATPKTVPRRLESQDWVGVKMRLSRAKTGDAMGRPTFESSLLGVPDTKFFCGKPAWKKIRLRHEESNQFCKRRAREHEFELEQ